MDHYDEVEVLLEVFPESHLWYDGTSVLLMGRRGVPLEIDVARMRERLD